MLDSRSGDGSEAALALLDDMLGFGARCGLERVVGVVCLGSKRDLLSAGVASEPALSAPSAANRCTRSTLRQRTVRLERLVVWTVGSF